jgi:prepilin-type N-terminal cleavage/methylation domain-containing protein
LRLGTERPSRRKRGFTLVEVIVVLVILAILAAIAIPALTGYIDKAGISQFKSKVRTAAVAMQTILSEAYSDPQTRLPVGGSSGALYVDGKMIANIDSAVDNSSIRNTSEGMYMVSPSDQAQAHNLIDLLSKLDAPEMYVENSVDSPAIYCVLFDEHFSILAYLYLDPESFESGNDRYCAYNYDIDEDGSSLTYTPSAGPEIWSWTANKFVQVG